MTTERQFYGSFSEMSENDGKDEPPEVQEYVALAEADGFRPTSVEQGRQTVLRYAKFLANQLATGLGRVGWEEYAAYKTHLAQTGISRATAQCYLFYLTGFYRLRAQVSLDSKLLDAYMKVRAIGVGRPARGRKWRPLDPEVVQSLLKAAEGEDRVFLMTLLYTGGRAQFYGLKVGELDFERGEITTDVKGGKVITIPLHPKLARVLKKHLASRGYRSRWLFRNGKDVSTLRGQRANRQNAWRICKRVQRQAGIEESVHPHRFRKTLAAYGRRTGLDPQFLQAILAHAHLSRTLEEYTQVELEDVKRQFARLDLVNGYGSSASSSTEARDLLERLRDLGPEGKEHAWVHLVDGLMGLISTSGERNGGNVSV